MVKISADSTCDLSPELRKRYDVAIQPLYIVKDSQSLRDGVDIRPTDIFDYVEKTGKLLKTSAVSVEDYIGLFRRLTADGSEVVHVTISAEMSACYQNACLAAREVPGVYPVDSRNLSTGMGLVVIEAAKRAQAGESGADIQKAMEELQLRHRPAGLPLQGWPLFGAGGAGREPSALKALHRGAQRQNGRGPQVPRRL
mgnify:CR=1 FL=1